MPLEPLHFLILDKVVPSALLGNQTTILYKLSDAHRTHTQDLSGLFCSHQAHLAHSCTLGNVANQWDSTIDIQKPPLHPHSKTG